MKRPSKRHGSTIKSLPNDLLTEILAHVASSSMTNLFNAKLSCKEFYESGDDTEVFRRVSIEELPVVQWLKAPEVSSFLKRCEENNNPEALYRVGMVEFFSYMKTKSGLEYLKKAADFGHMEASYALGIILLCNNDKSRIQGLKLLNKLERSKSKKIRIRECRNRLKRVIRQLWINNFLHHQKTACDNLECNNNKNGGMVRHVKKAGWPSSDDEDEDVKCCGVCKWNSEAAYFCNMLRGI